MSSTTELMNVLEDSAAQLQKTQINLKKCPKARMTQGYLEARLRVVNDIWTTFKNTHQNLVKITPKEQRGILPYFLNEEFYIYEDLYINLQTELSDMLNSYKRASLQSSAEQSSMSAEGQNSFVKLPRILLPTFTGNYDEWPTFQDMFTSLVHENTSISDAQKLHYLKSGVSGEAASLLKHIKVTHKNYEQAWTLLKSRYGNKRLIINSILKRLFNQKKMTAQSSNLLKSLLDNTTECLHNLQNLDICTDSWDPVIIFLVVQKLDPESHKDWEQYAFREESEDLPTWHDLEKFLQSKYRTLELIATAGSGVKERPIRERSFHVAPSQTTSAPASSTTSQKTCSMCKENHTLCHCKEFTKLQPTERVDYIKKHNRCFNCLARGHQANKCRLAMSCRICQRRHHSLLHITREDNASAQATPLPTASHCNVEDEEDVHVNTMITSHHTTRQGVALLATAIVLVQNDEGHQITLRALIDQGSQASFISEKAAQMLKLSRQPIKGSVVGVGSMRTNIHHVVQLHVMSRYEVNFSINLQAYVMPKQLTTKMPTKTVSVNNWNHLEGLNLADPSYFTPGSIDLLLGVKEYAQILQSEFIKGPPGTPCAQKTNLGWILFGEINSTPQESTMLVMHHQVDIDEVLRSIWEIDTETRRNLTKEEKLCEEIYENTLKRTNDGRYIVKLPFNIDIPISRDGNTKEIAKSRLLQLERRFYKSPNLKKEYTKVLEEYIELKHMERVTTEQKNKNAVYLPHHAVVREDKETTKTRLVFDASCKGYNHISLNDELLVGPPLQEDLRNLIMRWRMKCVCYVSDIEKMYRQILVYPEDADQYQRILWRKNEDEDIEEYRLLRVTFGTASAPYLAVRTLHQIAKDEGINPHASRIIQEDFYMDDLISGEDTADKAICVAKDISDTLSRGGFKLSKWSSNNISFIQSIDPADRSSSVRLDLNIDGTVKALGVEWNLGTDSFLYHLKLPPISENITKRSILSDIQKLFDPLGWIAPSIVMAKILMQKLWLEKLNWDEHVSSQLQQEWISIRSDFKNVNDIEIKRWLYTYSTDKDHIEIHGFSDASMKAYAAVAYLRIKRHDGTIETNLIAARTRVAPIRPVSLPRLELCGAVLLSRLLKQIGQSMRIPMKQMYAWTDSTIVIAWLMGEPQHWKPFVANRVVEVIDNTNNHKWFHVDSSDNPADIASRGMLLAELKNCSLWWKGPKWLEDPDIVFTKPEIVPTELEMKKVKINVHMTADKEKHTDANDNEKGITSQFVHFNTLQELLRTITYCRRFLNYKNTSNCDKRIISTEQLEKSLKSCIILIQNEEFSEDLIQLKKKEPVKVKSNLRSLNPYLDEDGILRVGGRLRHSNLDEKHPIIIGNSNHLTPLIVEDAHRNTMHGGVQLMLCYIRSKYWLIKAKGLVKKFINNCLICAKQRATVRTQIMGDLPKERVTPSRAFAHSGVDFCGPFQIINTKGRGAKTSKAYISIFVCMSTKAVHLELVGDLTSEAFIGAFKRFVARRGKCTHLWSDQGRNFIGADKDLQAACRAAQLDFEGSIAESLASDGTQWHFIPAYSPNFGGLWEAGVKSVKYHLKRVLSTNLTYEEMATVLSQIEACLNSRPLSPLDDTDIDCLQPLTPGHFLIGQAPIVVPSPNLSDHRISNLSRWQYTQRLLNEFWSRWQAEYLTRLQQRPKWMKQKPEFEIGEIVLIKTDGLPPGKWSLGRVIDKHPGSDNFTRVYSIKSGPNVIKRSVTKLCALPIDVKS